MWRDRYDARWGAAAAVLLLSPVMLILYLPLALGHGIDLFAFGHETPLALALCAPGLYVSLQCLLPQTVPVLAKTARER